MSKKYAIIFITFLTFTSSAAFCGSAEVLGSFLEKSIYVGPIIGANFPTGSFGTNVSPVVGLTLGAKVVPMFGFSFFGTYNGQYSSGNFLGLSTANQTSRFVLTGEGNIFLSVLHLGLSVGAEINSWGANSGPLALAGTNAGFVFGPVAGVDVPLHTNVSVGADVHYLVTTLQGSQSNVIASLNVKFWL